MTNSFGFPSTTTQPREIIRPQEIGASMELDPTEAVAAAERIIRGQAQDIGEAAGDLFFGDFLGIKSAPEGKYAENSSLQEEKKQTALKNGQTEIQFNNPDELKYQQVLRSVQEVGQKVEQVSEVRDIQEEVRHEIESLSDDEFAEKAGYRNTSFRGPLRTVANKVWVSLQLIGEKLGIVKQQASGNEIAKGKGQAIGVMGENELQLGGENKHHFTQAAG